MPPKLFLFDLPSGMSLGNHYGGGAGEIWLEDVVCDGTESSIDECQHSDWGSHDCNHTEDVSIRCINTGIKIGSHMFKFIVIKFVCTTIFHLKD